MDAIKAGFAGGVGALLVLGAFVFVLGEWGASQDLTRMGPNLAASPANANSFDFGKELAAQNCNSSSSPVINVTQKVSNDADSGVAGNYWGFDSFNRTIQVWQVGNGSYCALVRYMGTFKTIPGTSPGATGQLTGNESGTFEGGYKATITNAQLKATPDWKTNGSVGSADYQCDASGNCPGVINWVDQYFSSGYTFDQPWWGWVYRSGGNHAWVNAIGGNHGDII